MEYGGGAGGCVSCGEEEGEDVREVGGCEGEEEEGGGKDGAEEVGEEVGDGYRGILF